MSLEKLKEKRDRNLRSEFITKMLASFTVTAVVAVTVVLSPDPTPAAAKFLLLSAVTNEIVYRVDVSDPELTIAPDSLKVVIESPFERYEELISLGISSGTHIMTYENSEYTLSIRAKRGFGEETLTRQSVVASKTLSGAIIDFQIDKTIDLTTNPQELRYKISTLYADPQLVVEQVNLEYAYAPSYYVESNPEYIPESFTSIPITDFSQETWIEGIRNSNYVVFVRLMALLSDSEVMTLDRLQFTTPFVVSGNLYQTDLGTDYVEFYFSREQASTFEATFTVNLFKDGILIDHQNVVTSSDPMGENQTQAIRFENLSPETNYQAVLMAEYIDPNTFEQKNVALQTIEFTTLYVITGTLSGSISGYNLDENINLSDHPQSLRYNISTVYEDPQLEVSSISLEYGYVLSSILVYEPSRVPESYSYVTIDSTYQDSWIESIPNYNFTVFVRLIATLLNSETVVLDELQFKTPLSISAYLNAQNQTTDSADLVFTIEIPVLIAVSYSADLYSNNYLIETKTIDLPSDPSMQIGPHTFQFTSLTPNTLYSVIFSATYINQNTSFEQTDILQTAEFSTNTLPLGDLSGSINSFTLDPMIDLQTNPEILRYSISTTYDDPKMEVSSISLKYGYVPTAILSMNPQMTPQFYVTTAVTAPSQDNWIEEIPNFNNTVFVQLVATLMTSETMILAETQFTTPFVLNTYIYASDVSYDSVSFSLAIDPTMAVDVDYSLDLFLGGVLIESIPFTIPAQAGMVYEAPLLNFYSLLESTTYDAVFSGTYVNPDTLLSETKVLQNLTVSTSGFYYAEVSMFESSFTFEMTAYVGDEFFVLQNLSYQAYENFGGYPQVFASGPMFTESSGSPQRIYTASFTKPLFSGYTIEILCDKLVGDILYTGCLLYSYQTGMA